MPPAPRRILAFIPHPDDEAYALAGYLATAARRGDHVHVLSATRGEAGYDHTRPHATPRDVGATRSAELAASCALLGLEVPEFFDWPDGGLARRTDALAAAQLAAAIRDTAPDELVSLGPDGAYGHADHLACYRLTRAALALLRDRAPAWRVAAFPRGLFLPQWQRMTEGRDAAQVERAPPVLGIDETAVDLRLPLTGLRDLKIEAIAAHRSQLPDGDPHALFPPGIVARLCDEEWFVDAAR